jgi:glycosyltransferase involved in cell wall biosynthesis
VVTHSPHKLIEGRLVSFSQEVVELDCVGSLFDQVQVFAPVAATGTRFPYPERAYEHPSVSLLPAPFPPDAMVPEILTTIRRLRAILNPAAAEASGICVWCPSEPAMVSLLLLAARRQPTFIKYRGAWEGFDGEPLGYKLQRALIRSRFRRSFVGVYRIGGDPPRQFAEMFATALSQDEMDRASAAAASRQGGGTRLISVGALRHGKNVDLLIKALALLPEGFTLTIVGDGPERSSVERLADSLGVSGRTHFTGTLDREELYGQLTRADLFLLASRREGYSKGCVEAMAHGLPCVVSPVPALVEGRGLSFTPNDGEDLRDKILRLAGDDELYLTCSRNARRFAEDKTLECLKALYEVNLTRHGILRDGS